MADDSSSSNKLPDMELSGSSSEETSDHEQAQPFARPPSTTEAGTAPAATFHGLNATATSTVVTGSNSSGSPTGSVDVTDEGASSPGYTSKSKPPTPLPPNNNNPSPPPQKKNVYTLDDSSSDDEDDIPDRDTPPKRKTLLVSKQPVAASASTSKNNSNQRAASQAAPSSAAAASENHTSNHMTSKPKHSDDGMMDLSESDSDDDDKTDELLLSPQKTSNPPPKKQRKETVYPDGFDSDNYVDLSQEDDEEDFDNDGDDDDGMELEDHDDDSDDEHDNNMTSIAATQRRKGLARKSIGGSRTLTAPTRRNSEGSSSSNDSSSASASASLPQPPTKRKRSSEQQHQPTGDALTEEQWLMHEKEFDKGLEVGVRVYVPWPTDNMTLEKYNSRKQRFYFGVITKKIKISGPNGSFYYVYDIHYDDGDVSSEPLRSRFICHERDAPKQPNERDRKKKAQNTTARNKATANMNSSSIKAEARDADDDRNNNGDDTDNNVDDEIKEHLKRLDRRRCMECSECTSEKCGRCVLCREDQDSSSSEPHSLCFSKICSSLRARKCPASATLPEGFCFLIEDQKAIIYDHNNYASNVAKAMLTYPEKFRNFDPKTFFEYIGLPVEERVQQVLSAISKGNSASDIAGNQAAQEQQRNRWTPAQLFQKRCGNCCQCKLKDCGRCESCRHNNDRTGLRQVCLRKPCSRIPQERVQQQAAGLPPGWTFSFDQGSDSDFADSDGSDELNGLRLFDPNGNEYPTVEDARASMSERAQEILELSDFYKKIGAPAKKRIEDHFLVGKGVYEEWLDVEGKRRNLFGTVTKVEGTWPDCSDGSSIMATVSITDACKDFLRSTAPANVGENFLIKNQFAMKIEKAWAGYAAFCSKQAIEMEQTPRFTMECVRVPDAYSADLHYEEGGLIGLPRVQMQFRSFLLTFTTKKSGIEGAGYGVFLSCKSLRNDKDRPHCFVLSPGELLDFGVYAPLHPNDLCEKAVLLLKSFVLQGKPEKFTFDTDEAMDYVDKELGTFDITDDFSGDLNSRARRSLPPYVNEVADPEQRPPEVHAGYDPEGFLHYYLGYKNSDHGDFRLEEGTEIECLVDYGENYENVRIRSGYSRKSPEEAQVELTRLMEKDEPETLLEILAYDVEEVIRPVSYFWGILLARNRRLDQYPLDRALLVVIMLKKRIETFLQEISTLDPAHLCYETDPSSVQDIKHAYDQVLDSIAAVYTEIGNEAEVRRRSLVDQRFYSAIKIALGLGQNESLLDLSPRQFRDKVTSRIEFG